MLIHQALIHTQHLAINTFTAALCLKIKRHQTLNSESVIKQTEYQYTTNTNTHQ